MSTEQNKNVILRWRQGLNERNLNVIDDLFAPEYVGHITGVPGPVRGPVAFKQLFTAYLAAFDISVTPEFLIAEGDMVAVHDVNRVKHTGDFQGYPADGQGTERYQHRHLPDRRRQGCGAVVRS